MAESNSQDLIKNFLQDAITDGKIVPVAFERCPLCLENRSFLLCNSCVNKGSFTHSRRWDTPNFRYLREVWKSKEADRETSIRRFELQVDDIERANLKRAEIENLKRKIQLLKKSISVSRSKCKEEKLQLREDKLKRRHRRAFLEQNCQQALAQVVHKISDYELTSQQTSTQSRLSEGSCIDPTAIKDIISNYNRVHQDLCRTRSAFIGKLREHIFFVEEVQAVSDADALAMSMATALKDACETAFIGGRWVHIDHKGENHYQIVSSTLPDYSGESSATNLFVMANNHGSDKPADIAVGNPCYGIQAAISYTAMLVQLMSVTLSIHLPRRFSFRELCDDLKEQDFSNFVWRLHENTVHLASSQLVKPDLLVQHLSLRNVIAILQSKSLGRDGPFLPDYTLPVNAELCALEYACETETVTDTDLSKDWERVPVGIPSFDTNSLPPPQPGNTVPTDPATASALITNAAASLANWWRSYYD